MTKHEFWTLTDKFNRGECTPEEEQLIIQFCNDAQVEDVSVQWELSEEQERRIRLLKRINEKIDAPKSAHPAKSRKKYASSFRMGRIAATLLLLIGLGYGILHLTISDKETNYVTQSTKKGQQLTITLNDGSVVQLNAGSTLQFPEEFLGDERNVILSGEAFFEIEKNPNKPFVVQTASLRTQVLGTSFNIQAYEDNENIEVTVATGKVKVQSSTRNEKEEKAVFLLPEQQAVFNRHSGTIAKKQVLLNSYLGWTDGLLVLDNDTMDETVKKLGRLYDVKFDFDPELYGNCIFTGEFKKDTLRNILDNISFMTELQFVQLSDKTIKITGNPCK